MEAVPPVEQRIKVVARVRPSSLRENHGSVAHKCVSIAEDNKTIVLACKPNNKQFTFDYAAGEDSTQEEIFEEVGKPVTQACLQGYHGTILCYGQTGSGKTFTTFGPSAAMENALDPADPASLRQRGLVPRVLEYLFDAIAAEVAASGGRVRYSCRCSFYEIFNERVFDLLDSSTSSGANGLNVREDTRKGVYVENLTEEGVTGADAAGSILNRGYRNRHVGETAMNRESSRSHAVFTLVIEAVEEVKEEGLTRCRVARFNLVDLAGSERQKSTQTGGDRLKEASSINGSLSTLGQVISALVEKSCGRDRHVAYRNSRLTFLLRDSLGGNSKTMLVAAVSPADVNFAETLSTLKFAQRAKMIKNMAIKNEDTSGSFEALKAEVSSLRAQLAAAAGTGHLGGTGASLGASLDTSSLPEGYLAAHAAATAAAAADPALALGVLTEAIRRVTAAEAARDAANRRAAGLAALAEKAEKTTMQKEMILKFRDSALAAQRKKDTDAEKAAMAEEIAFLQKEIEGGDKDSQEVSKWRLAYKEAEAQLCDMKGLEASAANAGSSSAAKQLVWTLEDQTRFTSALDDQVVELAEEVALLRSGALSFENRLEEALETAAHTAQAAANSKELEAKQMIEDALLKKLQESDRARQEAVVALTAAEARAGQSEAGRTELLGRVGSLAKHLEDERKRAKAVEEDRDQQLAALQAKIEALAVEREAANGRDGTELSALRGQLATAIKDNGLLLQRARDAAGEADEMEDELDRAKAEVAATAAALRAEQERAQQELSALESQMKLQEEAHEREIDEKNNEKLALGKDFDALQETLSQQQHHHTAALAEAAATADVLREQLCTATANSQELESKLAALQDECDTLTEEVAFSNGRVEELESHLTAAQTAAKAAQTAAATELETLKEQAEVRETELSVVIANTKREAEAAVTQAAALHAELQVKQGALASLTAEATSAAERHAAAAEAAETAAAAAAERLKRSEEQCAALQTAAAAAATEHAAAVQGLEVEKTELVEALEQSRTAAQAAQTASQTALQGVREQLQVQSDAAVDALQRLEYTQLQLQQQATQADATAAELETAQREVEELRSELSGLHEELSEERSAADSSAAEASARSDLLSRKVTVLASELESVNREKTSAEERLADQTQQTEQLNKQLTDAREMAQGESLRVTALTETVAVAEEKLSIAARDLAASTASTSELKAALAERERYEKKLKAELAGVTADLQRVTAQLDAKTALASLLQNKLEASEEEKQDATNKSIDLEDQVQALQAQLETVQQSLLARDVEVERHQSTMARHTAAQTALAAELDARKSALTARAAEVQGLQQLLTESSREYNNLKKALNDTQVQLQEATSKTEASQTEIAALTEKIEGQKAEIVRLQEGALSPGQRGALEGRLCAAQSESHCLAADVLRLTQYSQGEAAARAAAEESAANANKQIVQLTSKLEQLQHTNASLVGHNNVRQKIKQHEKLKEEIIDLQRKNKELTEEAFRLRKQLSNSTHTSANTSAATSGTTSVTGHSGVSRGTGGKACSAATTASATCAGGSSSSSAPEDDNTNDENCSTKYNLRSKRSALSANNHVA